MTEIHRTETHRSSSYGWHRKVEFTLVAALERLREIARSAEQSELTAQIAGILERIADHRFSIAVVGEFNRGKSTFINALLGHEILPADVVPTSATINRVTYGLKPSVRIRFKEEQGLPTGEENHGGEKIRERTVAIDELAESSRRGAVTSSLPL